MLIDLLKKRQYDKYVEYTNQTKIVFKENKSKYSAINKSKKYVYKLKIDKGMLKDHKGLKCDCGLYIEKEQVLILIELKGVDVEKAFNQVLKTYEWLYNYSDGCDVKLKIRIIITHYDRHFNIDYARKKLIKLCKWHINDIVVREEYEDRI